MCRNIVCAVIPAAYTLLQKLKLRRCVCVCQSLSAWCSSYALLATLRNRQFLSFSMPRRLKVGKNPSYIHSCTVAQPCLQKRLCDRGCSYSQWYFDGFKLNLMFCFFNDKMLFQSYKLNFSSNCSHWLQGEEVTMPINEITPCHYVWSLTVHLNS